MKGNHPYRHLPDHCFWRGSIADVPASAVDPVVSASFTLGSNDRVVTAGSCFAQHIARHLRNNGFTYFITETAHPLLPTHLATEYGYGVFSARYGNVYTSRQLVQLLRRAYGMFRPREDIWQRPDGRMIDPFRPQIQPDGFASMAEYWADRAQHFRAVRRAIEELDVFVFTLGLTEAWASNEDGAIFPLCPGVAGGVFDPTRHSFINLSIEDVVGELREAIDFIRGRNPAARVILTVSPVPLAATAENRSVLVSTTLSKSVLRVAAETLATERDYVAYFPSYEIITGAHARGAYFADDLRSVTEAGIAHVMRLFMKHYAHGAEQGDSPSDTLGERARLHAHAMEEIAKVICDEEVLDAQR